MLWSILLEETGKQSELLINHSHSSPKEKKLDLQFKLNAVLAVSRYGSAANTVNKLYLATVVTYQLNRVT